MAVKVMAVVIPSGNRGHIYKKKLMGDIYRAVSTVCLHLGGRYMGICFIFIHHIVYLCLMYFL